MGWQTDLFCNITFNRETYNSLYEVNDRIEELEKCLNTCKKEIRDLVMMTEPEKFYDKKSYSNPYEFVNKVLEGDFELIEEYNVELYKLYKLRENWEKCHDENGLAIDPPDCIGWDTAFLDGDFVKTIKYPNVEDKL